MITLTSVCDPSSDNRYSNSVYCVLRCSVKNCLLSSLTLAYWTPRRSPIPNYHWVSGIYAGYFKSPPMGGYWLPGRPLNVDTTWPAKHSPDSLTFYNPNSSPRLHARHRLPQTEGERNISEISCMVGSLGCLNDDYLIGIGSLASLFICFRFSLNRLVLAVLLQLLAGWPFGC
jgi:hypothetical protein